MNQFDEKKRKETVEILKRLSTLQKGQTISSTDMSIVDHSSWTTAAWRTYAGESREKTLNSVRDLFNTAISFVERDQTDIDMVNAISDALRGVDMLKLTYTKDVKMASNIQDFITEITAKVHELGERILDNFTEEEIAKLSESDSEKKYDDIIRISDSASDLVQMVQVPNRDDGDEEISSTASSPRRVSNTEATRSVSDIDFVRVVESDFDSNSIHNEMENFVRKVESDFDSNSIHTDIDSVRKSEETVNEGIKDIDLVRVVESENKDIQDNESVDLIQMITQSVNNIAISDSETEASFYEEPLETERTPLVATESVKRSQSSNVDLSSYNDYDERSTNIKNAREKRSHSTESLSLLVSESTDTPKLETQSKYEPTPWANVCVPKTKHESYTDTHIYIPPSESFAYPSTSGDPSLDRLLARFTYWLAARRSEEENSAWYTNQYN